MLKELINKVTSGINLSLEEASQSLDLITSDNVSDAEIASLLTAMAIKGETVEEISGFAIQMRAKAKTLDYSKHPIYDCCGTGGDFASTINVSTASALVAAAAGVYIAKHSNRSMTSLSGSSDVLEALDISLSQNKKSAERSLDKYKIAFLHAPSFHSSTKKVSNIRKQIGIKTIFNVLGPLTNPANLSGQLIGASSPELCKVIADVLKNLGVQKAMVVCAIDPRFDEISICGNTLVYEIRDGKTSYYTVNPEMFGFGRSTLETIKGCGSVTNANIIKQIFENKITDARKDIILLNTAAILYLACFADSIQEGVKIAEDTIKSGKAIEKLNQISE